MRDLLLLAVSLAILLAVEAVLFWLGVISSP